MAVLDVADTSTQTMANLMVGRDVVFAVEKAPPSFGEEVLRVTNLTVKNSDGFPVVRDVSFSVRAGEIFAIAGVSGNGQTEIADAITGMLEPAAGTILLKGRDITHASVRSAQRPVFLYTGGQAGCRPGADFNLADNLALKSIITSFCERGSPPGGF